MPKMAKRTIVSCTGCEKDTRNPWDSGKCEHCRADGLPSCLKRELDGLMVGVTGANKVKTFIPAKCVECGLPTIMTRMTELLCEPCSTARVMKLRKVSDAVSIVKQRAVQLAARPAKELARQTKTDVVRKEMAGTVAALCKRFDWAPPVATRDVSRPGHGTEAYDLFRSTGVKLDRGKLVLVDAFKSVRLYPAGITTKECAWKQL